MVKIASKYKRILVLFVSLILCFSMILPMFGNINNVKAAEEKSITVFSWEDYLDLGDEEAEDPELQKSLLDVFEEKTGIHVNYHTFATNEEMYNEILKDPDACDLVCPSEYMIMKMRDEGLIKPFKTPQNYIDNGSPYIKKVFKDLGLSLDNDMTYSVGYMWGTMGFIYSMEEIEAKELNHWSCLWDEKFNGRATIKDSLRDTYILAVAAVYEDELLQLKAEMPADYNERLTAIFNRTDDETIAKVEDALISLKSNLYGFEVDGGKNDMVTGKIDINFAWSGDAVAAIDEAEEVGKILGYTVPEEGSNVWFDGWVMTKNADTENAREFIDFICSPYAATRNMDYIGYVSCVGGDDVFDYVKENYEVVGGEYKKDLSYFFDPDFFTNVAIDPNYSNPNYVVYTDETGRTFDALYADWDVINRCAVMENFSNDTLIKLNDMWFKVKLITLSTTWIIVLVVIIVLGVAAIVIFKNKDKLFPAKIPNTKKKVSNIGYKVISKEETK